MADRQRARTAAGVVGPQADDMVTRSTVRVSVQRARRAAAGDGPLGSASTGAVAPRTAVAAVATVLSRFASAASMSDGRVPALQSRRAWKAFGSAPPGTALAKGGRDPAARATDRAGTIGASPARRTCTVA